MQPKLLMPIPKWQWRTPSQAQQKDVFGNENQTRFRIRARLHDGHIVWCGWFDDRDDFDAFLWAIANGSLQYERDLWRLPTPWWHPDLGEELTYDFVTTKFITSTSASNQSDPVPTDWNNGSNNVDLIASGGSGGAARNSAAPRVGAGGGGGAWSQRVQVSLTPGGTATFFLNVGAAGVTAGAGAAATGNTGADAFYNGTTLAGSSVGAKGGVGGGAQIATNTTATGGAGGALGSGVGSSLTGGGAGGNASTTGSFGVATGGGGAGGGSNNGTAAAALTSQGASIAGAGGQGDGTSGGAGGAAATGSTPGGTGVGGTEYDATHGSGGGGGGAETTATVGGLGGNYGGGGGGSAGTASATTSGAGQQGLIIRQYTPIIPLYVPSEFEFRVPQFRTVAY